jgi:hypothetical protein
MNLLYGCPSPLVVALHGVFIGCYLNIVVCRNEWIADGEKRNSYIPSRPEEYYTRTGDWISWVRENEYVGVGVLIIVAIVIVVAVASFSGPYNT